MKDCRSTHVADALTLDLQEFSDICQEALALARREHEALSGQGDYNQLKFYERRKVLLADIEAMLPKFRRHRNAWQQVPQSRSKLSGRKRIRRLQ